MTQEQVAVTAEKIRAGKTSLGIEFGSTRIKAVLIDDAYHTIAAGDYEWASHLEDGLWSYTQEEIWKGLQTAYARMAGDVETAYGERLTHVGHIGFSAMMHGYLAFDKSGELLVPFRTWQNTNTHEAHEKLSELFQYNIPERWSVAHLYQAVLNHEEHVSKVDYITTLAGYVHWKLTGEKVLGVGDASGMFPIDPATHTYETEFIKRFDAIEEVAAQPWKLENLLPRPLVAGTPAGTLTAEGAKLLDPTGTLQPGVVLAPPEGDAGTGMVATNSVRVRTGNVSAGTSIFAMVVLEHKLARLHPEVDLVTTPAGDLAGMSHANNFTSDLNAWVGLFGQFAAAIGQPVDAGTLYGTLFRAATADDVDADCGGLLNYPFRSGEFLAGLPEGRPLFARSPEARMSLGNFMRTQLFSAFSPVKIGGREYIDGGAVSPVPVRYARQMGAEVIIAVDISAIPEGQSTKGAVDILLQTFNIMGHAISQWEMAEADVVMRPKLQGVGSADFGARRLSIMAGREAALTMLPKLRERIQSKTQ